MNQKGQQVASKFTVIKDSVLLMLGTGGIAFQQITGTVSLPLLGVYLTLLGIPGLSSGRWLLKQIGEEQSSLPPSQPSPGESQQELGR
jgi:hypothetical protein